MKRNPRARFATGLAGCLLLSWASAAMAIRITVQFPSDLPKQHVVQPGESTTFAIDFTNLDNFEGIGVAWVRHFLPGFGTEWLIEPLEPDVCQYPVAQEGLRIDFGVELQGSETRRCIYTLTRATTTYRDGYIRLCPGPQPTWFCQSFDRLVFGTLPDIGVSVTPTAPVGFGATDITYRIEVSNASAVPTNDLTLYNECRQPAAANPANLPFRLEVGFPGACPTTLVRGCSPEPPLTSFGWQVTVPSVPARGSTSCLVRVRVQGPFDTSINDRFAIWSSFPFDPGHPIPLLHAGATPNQGQGYDMNRNNDLAPFALYPAGFGTSPVPIGNAWLWSILVLTLLAAATLAGPSRSALGRNQDSPDSL